MSQPKPISVKSSPKTEISASSCVRQQQPGCAGPRETYDTTGRRIGAPHTKRRLKLDSIKPIEEG